MDTVPDGRGQDDNPGNAQPRPDTHPLNSLYRGVSRISARGVLKVRSHTKSEGGGGGGGPAKAPSAPPPPGSYASETVYNFDQEGAQALRE